MRHRNRGSSAPLPRLGVVPALALGVAGAAASIGIRLALTPFLAGEERFIAIFPVLLIASFYGGAVGGLSCLSVSIVGDWFIFGGDPMTFDLAPHEAAGLLALLVSGGMVVAGALSARRLVRRLNDANEAERLLAGELQHRVRNNLAVVEALARQTARGAGDLEGFLPRFLGRLRSLSTAYVLLSRESVEVADLGEVVAAVLEPFASEGRLSWRGEPIALKAQQTVALSLCLHELATNAVKYGALSGEAGVAAVSWARQGGGLARIVWEERGGPPVRPPARAGSGAPLLRRGLEPGRPAHISYGEGGVVWSAEFHPAVLAKPQSPRRSRAAARLLGVAGHGLHDGGPLARDAAGHEEGQDDRKRFPRHG